MKQLLLVSALSLSLLWGCAAHQPSLPSPATPLSSSTQYKEVGIASWYGPNFHGKLTANGEIYDMYEMTAAHRTLPFHSIIKVTNLENGRSVVVRINDRGPYAKGRILDCSKATAKSLGMIDEGTAKVKIEMISLGEIVDRNLASGTMFAIQVGSFSYSDAARKFLSSLQNRYPSQSGYLTSTKVNGREMHRVRLGPYTTREQAEGMLRKLQKDGYEGLIVTK